IKILSGDHSGTVLNIASAAGVPVGTTHLTGEQVAAMSDEQLREEAGRVDIYTRMFPEAKLRVIEALKAAGETVAMTGDGVNDGPALKAAHIGIAMGERGTETARQAADLVISDDNLDRITEAIRHGRTIYANLKKAIRYLITIHIPILTTASLPVLLGWKYPTVFAPIHLIFLEIVMGPTCSIFYERESVEGDILSKPPRGKERGARGEQRGGWARSEQRGLLARGEVGRAILQGGVAAMGMLGLYFYFMQHDYSLEYTRTMVFDTLVIDNILLTFVNRSFNKGIFTMLRQPNPLMAPVLLSSTGFFVIMNMWPMVMGLFGLTHLLWADMLLCAGVSFVSVIWIEFFKR
ncbi:MAG TPA: cation-translocating P-type ATPase, partial [Puia sp.]